MINPTSPLSRPCWTVLIIMRVLYLRSMKPFSPPLALRERSRNGCSACSLRIIELSFHQLTRRYQQPLGDLRERKTHPLTRRVLRQINNHQSKIKNHNSSFRRRRMLCPEITALRPFAWAETNRIGGVLGRSAFTHRRAARGCFLCALCR